MEAQSAADMEALLEELDRGSGAAVIAEEALRGSGPGPLAKWLSGQPAWSDFPIVVLTHRGGGPERNPNAARLADALGNVTFLERPFHPTTLVSVATTALRGRRRQYEARAHLEEAQEAEARLRVALKAGRLGSWMLDIATGQLTCTESCKATFGLSSEHPLTYDDLRRRVHPDDREAMQQAVRRSIVTGADYEAEYRTIWPDGGVHWAEIRARVVNDGERRPAKLIGMSLDTTERKRTEEDLTNRVAERTAALVASERRFRAVFDSAFQMAILSDLGGRIVIANRTALDAVGLSDVAGIKLWESPWWAGTPAEARQLKADFRRAAQGELVRREVTLVFAGSQSRTFDFSLKPVRDGGTQVLQVVAEARDVTDLRRAEATLHQAQKMETIGQFTGGVAHDFNNLLMAIIANLELLERQVGDDPKLHRLVQGAMQGAKRGAALTQRLLAFARRQDLQPQAVDVAVLLAGMRQLLEQSVGPQIAVELQGQDHVRPVLVDPNQLELAILNLALNARDAMPEGGHLTIGYEEAKEPSGFVQLWVSDTGRGMDEATLKQAIEPFFSTKGLGKGTGLGLSMIHGLAVQTGGSLRLRSAVGQGTTAELLLPLAAEAVMEIRHAEPTKLERGTATILLVDDDYLVAMSTAMMLEDLGHRVIEMHSGAEALKAVETASSLDLLITDQAMPGMTGTELAHAVRRLRPDLPIILATGYAELPKAPRSDFPRLTKPYDQAQLAVEIGKVLAQPRAG